VPPTSWLVFADGSMQARDLISRLQRDGHAAIVVDRADRFAADDERHYTIDPHAIEHVARLFDALRAGGELPSHAIDFWSGATTDWLTASLCDAGWSGRVGVITRGAFSVTGIEPLDPLHALVAGVAGTVPLDAPVHPIVVDVATADSAIIANRVVREVAATHTRREVAYRGAHRWVSTKQPVAFGTPGSSAGTASGAEYLIVDGLTEFGLSIAEHLAARGADRIAILQTDGRDAPADPTGGIAARVKRIAGGVHVAIVSAPPAGAGGVFYNVVDSANARRAIDGLAAGSAAGVRECAVEMQALVGQLTPSPRVGIVCCAGALADGLRHFVTAASPADNRWTVVTSDAWSSGRSADDSLTAATFALVTDVLSSERLTDIHVGRALATRLAATASQTLEDGRRSGDAAFSPAEHAIAQIWRILIGVTVIGLDDDFFAIGGDSLIATQAAARLSRVFGIQISPDTFYDQPTIRSLAALVDSLLTVGRSPAEPVIAGRKAEARELLEL